MKIRVPEVRVGNILEHNGLFFGQVAALFLSTGLSGKLLAVTGLVRANTAQRSAFFQAELRDIKTGVKTKERFRSEETVERVQTPVIFVAVLIRTLQEFS